MARARGKLDVVATLHEAEAALQPGVDRAELAVAALLAVWRARRVPRIAELVAAASAGIARPPIAGKTVAERTAAWREIARLKDPGDVDRLLATPWPGTWADAQPIVD